MMNVVNVVYAADEKFAEILSVSLESLVTNNKHVVVYILNNGIKENSVEKLKRQAERHGSTIHFMPLRSLKDYAGRELSCQKKITATTYFRLFLPEIMPEEVERVLYIDCDTLVLDDLSELYNSHLINTCGNVAEPTAPLMKRKVGLKPQDTYVNAGIMLIDLKRWREDGIDKKFISYIEEMDGNISFEDQGVINHVLKGKIDILPVRYNVETQYFDFGYDGFSIMKKDKPRYKEKDAIEAMDKPGIIHFTNSFASERPWVKGSKHRYVDEWMKYKDRTEWKDSPLWESNKDAARKLSRMIYRVMPRAAGLSFIYFANGVVRPLIGK